MCGECARPLPICTHRAHQGLFLLCPRSATVRVPLGRVATDLLRPLRMISFFRYLDQFLVYLRADWTVGRRMCTSVTAIHPPSASGASFVVSSLSRRCADLFLTKPAQCVPEGGAAKRHGTAFSGAAELSSASRVRGLPRRDEDRRLVQRAPAPNKSYSKTAHG